VPYIIKCTFRLASHCKVYPLELFGLKFSRFFYVEEKAFEIRSEVGNEGFWSAERSKGVYQAVILGKLSLIWLLKVEVLGSTCASSAQRNNLKKLMVVSKIDKVRSCIKKKIA
jgi:hypothetical protein